MDVNVLLGAGTLITSVIHNNPNLNLTFHLFSTTDDLTKIRSAIAPRIQKTQSPNKANQENAASLFGSVCIEYYDITKFEELALVEEKLNKIMTKANRNLTVASLYRLLVPHNISIDSDRLLYIDTDVLCNGDLSELCDIDIQNHVVAAISDWDEQFEKAKRSLLGFDGDGYFNGGVLLINLKKWIQENISEKALDYVLKYQPKQIDQDALNVACANKVYWLGKAYNSITRVTQEAVNDDTALLHYTGADKPWKPWLTEDRKPVELYRKYMRMFEPDNRKWFNAGSCAQPNITKNEKGNDTRQARQNLTDQQVASTLWSPSSVHDFKYMARLYWRNKCYMKSISARLQHIKLKYKRLGLWGIITCR